MYNGWYFNIALQRPWFLYVAQNTIPLIKNMHSKFNALARYAESSIVNFVF